MMLIIDIHTQSHRQLYISTACIVKYVVVPHQVRSTILDPRDVDQTSIRVATTDRYDSHYTIRHE